ncbi:MAG: helix-turn-helix transcriptional regulator [Thermomicrobiales bacterium]|nr:helix-turn-helix transcriptional regulator [Thermomicrobiales bacterium]
MTRQERARQFRTALRTLSQRECEVLSLRCKGKTNRMIAEETFTSYATVKNHMYRAVQKLKGALDEIPQGEVSQTDVVCFRLGYEMAWLDAARGIADLEEAA